MVRFQLAASTALLGFFGGLAGCQDYKFRQVCPETITEKETTLVAARPTPADILFVIDNSNSMADEQENLARNFTFFIDQIAGGDGDYRMAVVTTDQSNGVEVTGFVTDQYAPDGLRHVVRRTRDCRLVEPRTEHGCFLGPDIENRVVNTSSMTPAQQVTRFTQNVLVGSCGDGQEQGLRGMISALEQTANGECNGGFLREEANLVVIFLSDEDDASTGDLSGFVAELTALKDPAKIRLAAIVGSIDGEASQCNVTGGATCGSLCDQPTPEIGSQRPCDPMVRDQCPGAEVCLFTDPTCATGTCECVTLPYSYWVLEPDACRWCSFFGVDDCCSALPGNRYVEFLRAMESEIATADPDITATGCLGVGENERAACLIDSICQENFGATLERIAQDLIREGDFTLDPPALNPDGLVVRLTGGRFPAGRELVVDVDFQISEDGKTLRLLGPGMPEGVEEKVDIFYVSEVEQPTMMIGACGPQTSTTAN